MYASAAAGALSPVVRGQRDLVYVPSPAARGAGTVDVIDQHTLKVVDHFVVGPVAQHVVPSWDLKTLYVNASAANRLVPIDPVTGKPGRPIAVDRPYNLYFTPDGKLAVVHHVGDVELGAVGSQADVLGHGAGGKRELGDDVA